MTCRLFAFVSVAAAVATLAPQALAQVRGPYLQQGTPDSMVVAWRSASAEPSVVCYGASPTTLTEMASDPGTRTDHAVQIGGLSADTRYYYAVGPTTCPPASSNPEQYFVTSPPPGVARPFRMWVVGDSGTGGSRQQQVTDAMLAEVGDARPDIYLHMGDMAYSDGTDSEFTTKFFAMYRSVLQNTVVWPTMGNHEGHTSVSSSQSGPYYDAYVLPTAGEAGGLASGTEAYYSFEYANVHFVVLESHQTDRSTGGAMLTWLENDLAATDAQWIVAFWHHPPYTKGSHDSDGEGQLIDMRENALPILESYGVDLVMGGHSHIYERSFLVHGAYDTPTTVGGHVVNAGDGRIGGDGAYDMSGDGAVYVVAGHGGTGVRGSADHPLMYFSEVANGSCIVDVSGGSMTLRNIRSDGVQTDELTLVKEDGVFLTSPVGGESFLAGSTVDVTWVGVGDIGNVRIDFSLDAGDHWATVVDSTEDDGHHAWITPENVTTQARVRITALGDPTKTSRSGDFSLADSAWVDAIPFGGMWEYHDEGVDQGTTWQTEYGGWSSGPGQLGYGDGDEATTLRDEDPNIPSVYFRYDLPLESEVRAARMRILYDDGAAVWINGTQAFAANVADGTAFELYASSSASDNTVAEQDVDLSAGNPFVVGDNVIGVMVKQVSSSSSDLSFDFALSVEVAATDLDPIPWPPTSGGTDGGTVLPDGRVLPGPDGATGRDGSTAGSDASGGTGGGTGGGCACRAAGAPPAGGEWTWGVVVALLPLLLRLRLGRGRG